MVVEARLADLYQREAMLEAGWTAAMVCVEWQLPTFTKDSQNMAAPATPLDTLPAPSTDGVGEVYQWLKNILCTTAM
jgi:hypothetical protein